MTYNKSNFIKPMTQCNEMVEAQACLSELDRILNIKIKPLIHNRWASDFLDFGTLRRFLVIETAYKFIINCCEPYGPAKPLDNSISAEASMHLNILFINLSGYVDCIAWMICYETHYIKEDKPSKIFDEKYKRSISLFDNKIRKHLDSIDAGYSSFIASYETWNTELKSLRNPATHRIPMQIPPYIQLDGKSEGFYYPLFVDEFTYDYQTKPYELYTILQRDLKNITEITTRILEILELYNTEHKTS